MSMMKDGDYVVVVNNVKSDRSLLESSTSSKQTIPCPIRPYHDNQHHHTRLKGRWRSNNDVIFGRRKRISTMTVPILLRFLLLLFMTKFDYDLTIIDSFCHALSSPSSSPLMGSTNNNNNNDQQNIVDRYVQYWERLLVEEHTDGMEQLRERRSQWSLRQLEEQGLVIPYAYAEPESELYGEKTVRIIAPTITISTTSFSLTSNNGRGTTTTTTTNNQSRRQRQRRRPWGDLFGRGDILELSPLMESSSTTLHVSSFGGSSSKRSSQRLGRKNSPSFFSRECLVIDVGDDWMVVGVGPKWPNGLWESRKQSYNFPVRLDRVGPTTAPLKAQLNSLHLLRNNNAGQVATFLATSLPATATAAQSLSTTVYQERNVTRPITTATSSMSQLFSSIPNDNDVTTTPKNDPEEWAKQIPDHWHLDQYQQPATVEDLGGMTRTDNGASSSSSKRGQLTDMLDIALKESMTVAPWDANSSQQKAILWALQRKVSLIRGPPGTGKTRVAALLMATALRAATSIIKERKDTSSSSSSSPPFQILAVTHSNGAADVLLEALLEVGVPAIRAGRPATVSPKVQHRTVMALAEKMPNVMELRKRNQQHQQRKRLIMMGQQKHNNNNGRTKRRGMDIDDDDDDDWSVLRNSIDDDDMTTYMWDLQQALNDAQAMLVQSAPVVVTSCIGAHQLFATTRPGSSSSSSSLFSTNFPLVVLDEAAQCTEPALVCALAAANASQLVLVGDTQQLPPTVTSSSPELRRQLGTSPMERLERRRQRQRSPTDKDTDDDDGVNNHHQQFGGVSQHTLRVQYRLPPALLEHPSKYFYNGLVQSVDFELKNEEDGTRHNKSKLNYARPPAGFPWPAVDQPLAFVQVGNGTAEIEHTLGGRSNPLEAQYVVAIVRNLIDAGDVNASDIAIITPYAKQVQAIRSALERDMTLMTRARPNSTSSLSLTARKGRRLTDVRVGTVDSFQGQETEVVIFSSVRSNSLAELGFVRDARRLCVAITRARRALIILGDSTVLGTCHHWQALIQSCHDRGCWINLDTDGDDVFDRETPLPPSIQSKDGLEEVGLLEQNSEGFRDLDDVMWNSGADFFGLFPAQSSAYNLTLMSPNQ